MIASSNNNKRLRKGSWSLLTVTFLAAALALGLIIPAFAQQPVSVHYEYDKLDRLTKVIFDNSGASITYTYDGAGNRTSMIVQGSNIQPSLASLYPDTIAAGSHGFTLSVQGDFLINGAVIYWNGSPRTTTYFGAYVTTDLTDADLRAAGNVSVSVLNPSPNGSMSNSLTFNITPATPSASPSPSPSPAPSASPIELVMDPSGPAIDQVTAIDSVLWIRDPFWIVNSANLFTQGTDRNTRVMIFATNLQLGLFEVPANVVVNFIDSNNQSYDVPAEDVRVMTGFPYTQIIVRLPDNLAGGTCTVRVKAHDQITNAGTFRIRSGP